MREKKKSTSWEGVSSWYDGAVGKTGHYYHEKIILPKILSLLGIKKDSVGSLLDLACGQGILSRHLKKTFQFCTIILAIQNLESPLGALKNAFEHLDHGGKLLIVMNHPCFRIPRQSSWGFDMEKKVQYRRIDKYFSSFEVPISSHPSKGSASQETVSFHHPLSQWALWLKEAGFVIEGIEEWCSDKKSEGGRAKMEDIGRKEFPLFMTFIAKKL